MSAISNANPTDKEIKKKKKKSSDKGYSTYLHKVLKQVSDGKGVTISGKAMEIINLMVEDLENRVSDKAFELAKFQKKSTLAAPHIQTAAKLVFPPEMGGMAIQEGSKALSKYIA